MAFDGLFLRAMIEEIKSELLGMRLDKINQPQRGAFVFSFRNKHLLLSVEPSAAYLAMTDRKFSNPSEPPMFCMLLRKYLQGATLRSVFQEKTDRTAYFVFSALSPSLEPVERTLVAEIMGRHANLLLLDENRIIIDCIKRSSLDSRQALPGLPYEPFEDDRANLSEERLTQFDPNIDILRTYQGFSKISARFASENRTNIRALFHPYATLSKHAEVPDEHRDEKKESEETPRGYTCADHDGTIRDFYFLKEVLTLSYPDCEITAHRSLSEATNAFYMRSLNAVNLKKRSQDFKKVLTTRLERIHGKISKMREELSEAQNSTYLREYGDLLLSYAYQIPEGSNRAVLTDFSGKCVEIALDTRLSATENAQKYYRKYKKSLSAVKNLQLQIKEAEADGEYLAHALLMTEQAEQEEDIDAIRKELETAGFIGKKQSESQTKKRKKPGKKDSSLHVHTYRLTSGKRLLIGKSNTANDELTMKFASNSDTWLHTNTIPGSHCIIRCEGEEPTSEDLEEAAEAAAYYSKARNSSKVAVDYCRVKHVKKSPGARPGMVIYTNYKTVIVDPSVDRIKKEE